MMNQESYLTVEKRHTFVFEEKKSKFITDVAPVETEDEARAFIDSVCQAYPDATHHVYAYVNRLGNASRFSDDGEPQGTAGMPVFEVIRREGLRGVVIVVTRYFGGTLLGAGGLVRAYSKGANDAVKEAGITKYVKKSLIEVTVDYDASGKLEREFEKLGVGIVEKIYSDKVVFRLLCGGDGVKRVEAASADVTRGAAKIENVGTRYAKE